MGKKKNLVIDGDETFVWTEVSQGSQVKEDSKMAPARGVGGKKGKKGNFKGGGVKAGFELLVDEDNGGQREEDDASVVSFNGKTKSTKKGDGKAGFAVLVDGEGEEDNGEVNGQNEGEDEPVVSFTGKKKSKGSKKGDSTRCFALLEDEENDKDGVCEEDEAPSFVGKQKSSKSLKGTGSLFSASVFAAVGDGEGQEANNDNESVDNEEHGPISFTGKKKKPSKSSEESGGLSSELTSVSKLGDDEDSYMVEFTGENKSFKKKDSSAFYSLRGDVTLEEVLETNNEEVNDPVATEKSVRVVAEALKNKKNKKKGGKTAEEEDDLDKILAELGEGPAVSKSEPAPTPPTRYGKVDAEPEPVGLTAQSAATRKKKKKKDKEKEKKAAAAAEVNEEVKNNMEGKVDKKVPKHVREMQEALARRNETNERKKKEEEEIFRKEEEERLKQEELDRQAAEVKGRKKDRAKEKFRQKKEAGLLLTPKQKKLQCKREIMKNQVLANAVMKVPASDNVASAKRPIYTRNKPKPSQKTHDLKAHMVEAMEIKQEAIGDSKSVETVNVEGICLMDVEEKVKVDEIQEDVAAEEKEECEDWDAKSWDDTDLALPVKRTFEDEDADSVAQSIAKKEVKQAAQSVLDTVLPTAIGKPVVTVNSAVLVEDYDTAGMTRSKDINLLKDKPSSDTQATTKSERNLRSPICCIMGHVDTGKTKLLDCVRGTNVQEGEAGGITQQIGATYFPAENLRERTRELKADAKLDVPGLLVIDTPGHESFTNLRSRGSGLCDIAIVVVDIMHGLEQQTIESLNLLRMRNTQFIVALNKVDRLYGWKACLNSPIGKAMKQQSKDVQNEFNMRLIHIITQFKEQGLNTELYYTKKDLGETINIVPTSAMSGEGIPDLLLVLVQWSQKIMIEKLTFRNKVQCTVLEVKVVEGHGTTIDVVLINGVLHEGDQIVVCGMKIPIVTTIRALLKPHPMKELRVKGTYLHSKEIKAAQGIKIAAQGLEDAIAGTDLYVVGPDDDVEEIKKSAMEDKESVFSRIDKSGEGVYVQASTLGSLEALLEFLKSPAVNIPVSGISIGPVYKKDVMKASAMLDKKKEFATILAFDVKVTPDARVHADVVGVKIFMADIIYHLFDQFKSYIDNINEEKKREAADDAVFPCVLKILPNCVFTKKDPIVLGVNVLKGIIKMGTPLCIPSRKFIDIGRVASIENNHKPVDYAKSGQQVAIKIVGSNPDELQKTYGRHFDFNDELVSHISRKSIDILEDHYRNDDLMTKEEWKLIVQLKNLFKIQ